MYKKGIQHHSWKGGKPQCEICQKQLTHYYNKYCLKHSPNIFQRSKKGRGLISRLMQGNQYRKNIQGNGWKGDTAGYRSKHSWVVKHFGKPTQCEKCGKDGLTNRQIHWASKDHKYLRFRDNWIRLCVKCHWAYDTQQGLRKVIKL